MQKTPLSSASLAVQPKIGYQDSGITLPFAKAPTLSVVPSTPSQASVDPNAKTDPHGTAITSPSADPFLPPLAQSGVFRKVVLPYHWPTIIHPVQDLVIKDIIDKIVEKVMPMDDPKHPYYLDTLYQYALRCDYAEEKLRDVAKNNLRAQKLLQTLITAASTPSKAL